MLPKPPPKPEGLDLAAAIGQTELLVQVALLADNDGKAGGLLAFSGGLIAGDIAAQSPLGKHWWIPLFGLGIVAALCLLSLYNLRFKKGPDLDELEGMAFFEYGAYVALRESVAGNADDIRHKTRILQWATWLLIGTLIVLLPVTLATR